jgi:hypothetical protein
VTPRLRVREIEPGERSRGAHYRTIERTNGISNQASTAWVIYGLAKQLLVFDIEALSR